MQTDTNILQQELEADKQLESQLLLKELLVILFLVALTWIRETFLHGLFI